MRSSSVTFMGFDEFLFKGLVSPSQQAFAQSYQ